MCAYACVCEVYHEREFMCVRCVSTRLYVCLSLSVCMCVFDRCMCLFLDGGLVDCTQAHPHHKQTTLTLFFIIKWVVLVYYDHFDTVAKRVESVSLQEKTTIDLYHYIIKLTQLFIST